MRFLKVRTELSRVRQGAYIYADVLQYKEKGKDKTYEKSGGVAIQLYTMEGIL